MRLYRVNALPQKRRHRDVKKKGTENVMVGFGVGGAREGRVTHGVKKAEKKKLKGRSTGKKGKKNVAEKKCSGESSICGHK